MPNLSVADATTLIADELVPGTWYVYSQHTATPGTTGANECADANYLREPVKFGSASSGEVTSDVAVNFPAMATQQTIAGSGIWTAPQGTLTTALVSGTAYSSLAVSALSAAVASGDSLAIVDGSSMQVVVASAAAASGATSISVTSFTATAAFSTAAVVIDVEPGTAGATYKLGDFVTSFTVGAGVSVQYGVGAITGTAS